MTCCFNFGNQGRQLLLTEWPAQQHILILKESSMKTPGYYLPVMPYLIIDKVADFIEFAKTVFNAEEKLIVPGEDGRIVHGEICIGKAVIMFTDSTDHYKPFPAGMFLLIENIDAVFHRAISYGAVCLQSPGDREYGRSAGFQDRFGNQWCLTQPAS
jgi:PhnB protein